jgi:hypothetical protein
VHHLPPSTFHRNTSTSSSISSYQKRKRSFIEILGCSTLRFFLELCIRKPSFLERKQTANTATQPPPQSRVLEKSALQLLAIIELAILSPLEILGVSEGKS